MEEKRPQAIALISGILIAYAVTCLIFITYAILLTYTSMSDSNTSLVVTITGIVSVAFAGFDAAKGAKNKGWLWGIVAGAIYGIILLCIGAWISKDMTFDTRSVTMMVLCIAGGGLGGVIGINVK